MKEKHLRGFTILRSEKNRTHSIMLVRRHGETYLIIRNNYLFGVLWSSKVYEFKKQDSAEYFFEQISFIKAKNALS